MLRRLHSPLTVAMMLPHVPPQRTARTCRHRLAHRHNRTLRQAPTHRSTSSAPVRRGIVLRSISASSDQQAGCGGVESMDWETHSVTPDRFEDFTDVVNRSRRVNHCWCLSHRLQAAEIERLGGGSREQAMRRLCERDHPPGW